jgi:hypothetical protein
MPRDSPSCRYIQLETAPTPISQLWTAFDTVTGRADEASDHFLAVGKARVAGSVVERLASVPVLILDSVQLGFT